MFFLKDILKSLFLETLTEIIHPSAGSMAFGKAVCPPIKTTVDIYTSTQISPVYLFLNVFILTVVERYKKTDSQCEVEVTILYLQEDNTFFTRGFHISPIHSTNSFQQPVLSRVVSLNLALNRPCKCSIHLWIIVNAKDSNRANL